MADKLNMRGNYNQLSLGSVFIST